MFLPNRIKLTSTASNKFQHIKNITGVTQNITSRIALMLALKSNDDLKNAGVENPDGLDLPKDTLFGDDIDVYEVLIRQYMYDNKIDMPVSKVIISLIELGAHKMGHIKSLEQMCELS